MSKLSLLLGLTLALLPLKVAQAQGTSGEGVGLLGFLAQGARWGAGDTKVTTALFTGLDKLTETERQDLLALAETKDLRPSAVEGVWRADFDVYRDTPNFDNFTSKLTPGGTCEGFSFIVRDVWLRLKFEAEGSRKGDVCQELLKSYLETLPGTVPVLGVVGRAATNVFRKLTRGGEARRTIRGAADFRALCEAEPGVSTGLKKLMEAAFYPRNLAHMAEGLLSRFNVINDKATANWLLDRTKRGEVSMLALMPSGLAKGGHSVLGYKAVVLERHAVFYLYDCNIVYDPAQKHHAYSVLVYDRAAKRLRLAKRYGELYGDKFHEFGVDESSSKQGLRNMARAAKALLQAGAHALVDALVD